MCKKIQCIEALKVYDWVNRSLNIKLKELIELKKIVNNVICSDFISPCNGTRTTIFTNVGLERVTGSITIRYCNGCDGEMKVLINGKKVTTLRFGQTFSTTTGYLEKIEVECNSKQKNVSHVKN